MVFTFNNGTAQRVPIEVGFIDGDKVEVLAGIETGEEIITVGQEGLRDGAAVRIPEPNETQGTSPAVASAGAAGGSRGGAGGAGGSGGMRGMMQNLSEADRAKLQNMSQDERQAFMQTLREKQGGGDTAAPQQQVARRSQAGEQAAAQPSGGQAIGGQRQFAGRQAQGSGGGQRAQGAAGGRGSGGRMMPNLSDEDRATIENMSQEDRRAFFQARRAQQGNQAGGQTRSGGATETGARQTPAADGSAVNPDRIDRTLARLVEMDERIKTAWQARLAQDPGIQNDTEKKVAFLQEMITQLRSAQ